MLGFLAFVLIAVAVVGLIARTAKPQTYPSFFTVAIGLALLPIAVWIGRVVVLGF